MAPISYYLLDKSSLESLFKDFGISATVDLDDTNGKCTVWANGKSYDITDNSPFPVRQSKRISSLLNSEGDDFLLPVTDIVNYLCDLAIEKKVRVTRSCCTCFLNLVQLFARENCVDDRGFYKISYSIASMAQAFGIAKQMFMSYLSIFVDLGLVERSSSVQSRKPFSSYTMFMDLSPFLKHPSSR